MLANVSWTFMPFLWIYCYSSVDISVTHTIVLYVLLRTINHFCHTRVYIYIYALWSSLLNSSIIFMYILLIFIFVFTLFIYINTFPALVGNVTCNLCRWWNKTISNECCIHSLSQADCQLLMLCHGRNSYKSMNVSITCSKRWDNR